MIEIKSREYQICTRCIMDTSDPEIIFDHEGICHHCRKIETTLECYPFNLSDEEKEEELKKKIDQIKLTGKNKKYDCLIGLSGGVDSSYVAYLVKNLGLRPLAFHLDNGWNTEISVGNIEKIIKKLHIDLYTHVINWSEFKNLQLAFLKASTPDSEIPSDHAIIGLFYQVASKFNIKYMMVGSNFRTESILPRTWSHGHYDWKYIKTINKTFAKNKLKTYPHLNLNKWIYYKLIKRIRFFVILDYINYKKEEAIKTLQKELDWQPYGHKHHESLYTKFFQSYILPVKFGIDKRRSHLSSLICSGQLTRNQALASMEEKLYLPEEMKIEKEFVLKKLGVSDEEFNNIIHLPKKSFWNYKSYEKSLLLILLKRIYQLFKKNNILTQLNKD